MGLYDIRRGLPLRQNARELNSHEAVGRISRNLQVIAIFDVADQVEMLVGKRRIHICWVGGYRAEGKLGESLVAALTGTEGGLSRLDLETRDRFPPKADALDSMPPWRQTAAFRSRSEAKVAQELRFVDLFQFVALFVIGATVVWSAVHAYWDMIQRGSANVEDILLLFIYLELGAMVGIYFKTSRLPVQFLIYVAITVMTRSLASSLNVAEITEARLLAITGAIMILAISVLVLRYAAHRFPPFISHQKSDGVADNLKRVPVED